MGSVLKCNRYRLVDNRSFELPLPLKYELLKEDSPVAEYEVSEDEKVTCRIITKYKENMITPVYRPLDISDIYYFFSCRVFQDKTPFTLTELSLLGLEKYNVYDIIRKTRGVTPFDTYWLRFDGDTCDYETARNAWNSLMQQVGIPGTQKTEKKSEPSEASAPKSDADVNEILNQHKIDVAAKFAANEEISKETSEEPKSVTNNTMSADEIEALLLKSGLTDATQPDKAPEKPEPAVEEKPSGGKMSQEDIEAMLAAASAPQTETAPVEEKPSGGKMSQEDIEAMLAAAAAPQTETAAPEPAAVPAPAEAKPSGGKMNQEDIEAMLAAASAPQTETAAPEPAAVPAPAEAKPSGGKMSQEDIEAMLAAAAGAAEPAVEETAEAVQETLEDAAPKPSGGKMSQADIEALLNGMKEDAST